MLAKQIESSSQLVRQERHNFGPLGHYSVSDVTQLSDARSRQSAVKFSDD